MVGDLSLMNGVTGGLTVFMDTGSTLGEGEAGVVGFGVFVTCWPNEGDTVKNSLLTSVQTVDVE